MPAGDQSFPKARRISRRGDYLKVQGRGKRLVGRHFVYLWQASQQQHGRLGVTVTRRVAGAVGRNRIKRLVREAYRALSPSPPAVDVVVIARAGRTPTRLEQVAAEMARAMRRMTPTAAARPPARPPRRR